MLAMMGGGDPSKKWAKEHYDRVIADGGTIINDATYQSFFSDYYKLRGTKADTFCVTHENILGYKLTNGNVSKLYSINPSTDLIQETASARPILLFYNSEKYYYGASSGTMKCFKSYLLKNKFDLIIKTSSSAIEDVFYKQYQLLLRRSIDGYWYLGIYYGNAGAANRIDSAIPYVSSNWHRFKRIDNGNIEYYTSLDGNSWVLKSSTPNAAPLNQSPAALDQTMIGSGNYSKFTGELYYVSITDEDYSTPLLIFNPINYNPLTAYKKLVSTDRTTWEIFPSINKICAQLVYRNSMSTNGTSTYLAKSHSNTDTKTNYFTSNFINGYEITDSNITIGQKSSVFYSVNTGFLVSVLAEDSVLKQEQMRLFYDKYF